MPARLLNKVAVVTGAGRGIGRAVTEQLLQEGAKVVACARTRDDLDSLEQIAPARLIPVQADVTLPSDVQRLVELTQRRLHHVDILCPLAGNVFHADFQTSDAELVFQQTELNCAAAWRTLQLLSPLLTSQSAVCFLTAATIFDELPGLEHFAASKASLRALAKSLSQNSSKMRMNSVACAPVKTQSWSQEELQNIAKKKRWKWLTVNEVAEAIVYLVSNDARAISGQEIELQPR